MTSVGVTPAGDGDGAGLGSASSREPDGAPSAAGAIEGIDGIDRIDGVAPGASAADEADADQEAAPEATRDDARLPSSHFVELGQRARIEALAASLGLAPRPPRKALARDVEPARGASAAPGATVALADQATLLASRIADAHTTEEARVEAARAFLRLADGLLAMLAAEGAP